MAEISVLKFSHTKWNKEGNLDHEWIVNKIVNTATKNADKWLCLENLNLDISTHLVDMSPLGWYDDQLMCLPTIYDA